MHLRVWKFCCRQGLKDTQTLGPCKRNGIELNGIELNGIAWNSKAPASCVPLRDLLNLSEPHSPHGYNEDKKCSSWIVVMIKLDDAYKVLVLSGSKYELRVC